MYVQVRTIDGKQNVTVTVSKLTTVVQFKELVEKELGVKCEKQRLFFRGKQVWLLISLQNFAFSYIMKNWNIGFI